MRGAVLCSDCGADMRWRFNRLQGWHPACDACELALEEAAAKAVPAPLQEARDMVAAWPGENDEIIMSIGPMRVAFAVGDARRIAQALTGALTMRDNMLVQEAAGGVA